MYIKILNLNALLIEKTNLESTPKIGIYNNIFPNTLNGIFETPFPPNSFHLTHILFPSPLLYFPKHKIMHRQDLSFLRRLSIILT